MASPPLPEDIRRFVLTSIPSVPHLEALLLLRGIEPESYSAAALAERLYVNDKKAQALIDDLCDSGMVQVCQTSSAPRYAYHPASAVLRQTIDDLAALYGRRLVEITNLIHSSLDRKAQQFADAFKWRKDS